MILLLLLALLAPVPPTAVSLDAAGVAWTQQSSAARACVHVYGADWTGDARTVCAAAASGPMRVDVSLAPGEHVFIEEQRPAAEWGPFDVPADESPPLTPRTWLPLVVR
jgi:hypothetical protein